MRVRGGKACVCGGGAGGRGLTMLYAQDLVDLLHPLPQLLCYMPKMMELLHSLPQLLCYMFKIWWAIYIHCPYIDWVTGDNTFTELQIRGGMKDNSKKSFLICQ